MSSSSSSTSSPEIQWQARVTALKASIEERAPQTQAERIKLQQIMFNFVEDQVGGQVEEQEVTVTVKRKGLLLKKKKRKADDRGEWVGAKSVKKVRWEAASPGASSAPAPAPAPPPQIPQPVLDWITKWKDREAAIDPERHLATNLNILAQKIMDEQLKRNVSRRSRNTGELLVLAPNADRISKVLRLVMSFGSPDAFKCLRTTIMGMRTLIDWSNDEQQVEGFNIIKVLCKDRESWAEKIGGIIMYQPRFYKLKLHLEFTKHFKVIEKVFLTPVPNRTMAKKTWDEMIKEAYPKGSISKTKRSKLQHYRVIGERWNSLVNKYGVGVIFMMPHQGLYSVSNNTFDELSDSDFSIFLLFLEQWRGEHLRGIPEAFSSYAQAMMDGEVLQDEEKDGGERFPTLPLEIADDETIMGIGDECEDLWHLLGSDIFNEGMEDDREANEQEGEGEEDRRLELGLKQG